VGRGGGGPSEFAALGFAASGGAAECRTSGAWRGAANKR
jgi:hypothetical protein